MSRTGVRGAVLVIVAGGCLLVAGCGSSSKGTPAKPASSGVTTTTQASSYRSGRGGGY